MKQRSGLSLWLSFFLLVPGVTLSTSAVERPDFSGTWQINEEESEDLRQKMRQAMSERRQSGGGFPGGRQGGRGFGRGGGAGRGGGGRPGRAEGSSQRFGRGAPVLTIHHTGDDWSVAYGNDRTQVLLIGGDRVEVEDPRGGTVTVSAKWQDQKVVLKRKSERAEVTETYELLAAGERLAVTTEIQRQGPIPKVSVRRVYDSAPAALP